MFSLSFFVVFPCACQETSPPLLCTAGTSTTETVQAFLHVGCEPMALAPNGALAYPYRKAMEGYRDLYRVMHSAIREPWVTSHNKDIGCDGAMAEAWGPCTRCRSSAVRTAMPWRIWSCSWSNARM